MDMPACELLFEVIQKDINEDNTQRGLSTNHFLPIPTEERHRLIQENSKDKLLNSVQMIDDFTIGTSTLWDEDTLTQEQRNKIRMRMHTAALQQIFMTMIQASAFDEKTKVFQPAKLNTKKSIIGASSALFLGKIFRPGEKIINLQHYQNASCLEEVPETGEALSRTICFLNYCMELIPALSHKIKNLRTFAAFKAGSQKLDWDAHPDMAKEYNILIEAAHQYSGLTVLPNDLEQIHCILLAADACSTTVAYTIGIALKRLADKNNPETQQKG